MGVGVFPFIFAEPVITWFEDIIYEVLDNFPVHLFDEIRPWDSIITQHAFIHPFEIGEANELVHDIRSGTAVSNEPIFPKDESDSEANFKQFIKRQPLRLMLTGDSDKSYYEIGEELSKYFGSLHITPRELIKRQIIRNTRIGKWLLWNIKEGNGVPIWIVFKLLESELDSDSCVQKGFVLSGFPIIPELKNTYNAPCAYKDDQDYGQNLFLQECDGEDRVLEEGLPTEWETETISYCSSSTTALSSVDSQEDILNGFRNREFILFDGNEDYNLKRCARKQLDFFYKLWCRPNYVVYIDPSSYTKNFLATVDILQYFVLKYTKDHTLRVDSRIGFGAICDRICDRFKNINYKVNYECIFLNAHGSMSFEELINTGKVLPNYKWWVSRFSRMCPVSLYHGRRRYCDTRFPVRYLRYIFLCHSSKERKAFAVNPGKYIDLLPRCRIAVIGPHRIGKSTLSKYLAHYLKAEIYTSHIEESEKDINKANLTDIRDKALKKELKDLDALRLQDFTIFKQKKIEEWTTCALSVVNDILKALNKGKRNQPSLDLFNNKHADKCFQNIHKDEVSDKGVKTFILENAIFNKSVQSISPVDFINWVTIKSESPLLFRQYVLDSAPLDIIFWEELLRNDELPDCVVFMRNSSIKKMFDIYSMAHDESCIGDELIFKKLCSQFSCWKSLFSSKLEAEIEKPRQLEGGASQFSKNLVASRYKDAFEFVQKYAELQSFFQHHDVICVDIDVSKQTWTQSILKSMIEYLSVYQTKATPLYGAYLQNIPNLFNEMEETNGSISSSLYSYFVEKENATDSNLSLATSHNYGNFLDWCPVILHNHNILLKGDMRYAAKYKNKINVMHSREALIQFLSDPEKFVRKKSVIPPPRVYLAGLLHKNKTHFAESLASSLNVESVRKSIPIMSEEFSIQAVRTSYKLSKKYLLEDLSINYEKGAVIYGFPLLLEQFNDAIAHKLYPEYLLVFDDKDDALNTLVRFFSKQYSNRQSIMRSSSGTQTTNTDLRSSNIEWGIGNTKTDLRNKCRDVLKAFAEEVRKIELACQKLHIPVIKIPKSFNRGLLNYYIEQINHFREREAIFEIVQEITMKESELLLNSGYYRYSRFKRSCPVHVTQLITLNHFEGMYNQGRIFPCVHGDFIYFLCGKANLKDFKKNPLRFINTCNPPQIPNSIRVMVYGPSTSGVSTICRSMSKELGLKILSPNDIAENFITESAIIDLIKMNRLVTPNGIVLDNIPLTPTLLLEAAKNTVELTAVFIIVAGFKTILENWYRQNQNVKTCPSLELPEVLQNYRDVLNSITNLHKCTAISLFNIHYLDGDANSWTTWNKIKHILIKTTRCISGYRIKLQKNRCTSLGHLNLFYDTLIFKRAINYFYCQVCLNMGKLNAWKYFYVNVEQQFYSEECQRALNQPYAYLNDEIYKTFKFNKPFEIYEDMEPLRTQKKCNLSVFQYKNVYYWVCNDHIIYFMLYTQHYYSDREQLMPKYIPFLVIGYTKQFLAFDGFCPVEYERGKLVRGDMSLSAYYRKKKIYADFKILLARRVPVPDERFDFLCDYHKPVSKVPAFLNVVDIAGLVKGAAEGQGLGNAFLSHISACDSIFHLCRAFEDPDVTHVEGEVDPVRDLDIITEELRLKDEEKLSQNLDKLEKVVARGGDKKLKPEYDSLLKVKTILVDDKRHLRFADWNAHDIETLNKYMFLTTKPMIYLVNLSDKDFIRKKNKWLAKIKEWVDKNDPGATIIPFSGHFEHNLIEKDDAERKAYEDETKCKSVLDKIIVTGYKALQLEYFFTAGPDEVKAWTIQKGTKAPQAAGRIHTDFEKGFIMAEVMHFKDFKEEGSEAAAKSAGKYRQQGRNYVVEDGDIIFFKFNAGAGLKDAKKK